MSFRFLKELIIPWNINSNENKHVNIRKKIWVETNQILDVVALRTGMISVSVTVLHTENNFKIPCKIISSKRLYQHF